MKSLKITILAIAVVISLGYAKSASAQFMPVVYDNVYGKANQFITATTDFQSGDVVMSNVSEGRVVITWLDREGNSRYAKRFSADEISLVNKITPLSEDKVLIVGQRKASDKDKNIQTGRAMILNIKGGIERIMVVGENGTNIKNGQLLSNGNMILSGSTPNPKGGMSAYLCKVSPKDRVIYNYTAAVGEECRWFNVMGSRTEYLNAAFTSQDKDGCSVVRLDENGKPYFITTLADPTFRIEKMATSLEGDIYIVGQGKQAGGTVIKIRPEGDIVFQKQLVPATSSTKLDKLILCPTGELLVGGMTLKMPISHFCVLMVPNYHQM